MQPKYCVDKKTVAADTATGAERGISGEGSRSHPLTTELHISTKRFELQAGDCLPDGTPLMGIEEAMRLLSRDERFMATVYAMRTLLVEKGILRPEELDYHFRQWAQKHHGNAT